jgi:citrate lyase subunit beta-like protein
MSRAKVSSTVPGSNPRMLEKSLTSPADSIAYDLEDSVSSGKKREARKAVSEFLDVGPPHFVTSLLPLPVSSCLDCWWELQGEARAKGEVMVRINAVGTGYEESDLDSVVGPSLSYLLTLMWI